VNLFGKSPRVAILEAFAEDPDIEFSAPEIARETGVSRRGTYIHIRKLLREGVIVPSRKEGKGWYYRLNQNDRRAEILPYLESVVTLGRIERAIKVDEGIPLDAPLPRDVPSPFGFFVPGLPGAAANELPERSHESRFLIPTEPASTGPRFKAPHAFDELSGRSSVAT
jgi:DNA-binding transcriptional ArsR family regulator